LAVPDWPWSSENAPLPGDYRPWPGNPPAGPNHAAVSNTQDQVVKGKDQEIHEDDRDSDDNLGNLDTLSSERNDEKYEEEESWEENYAQTMTTADEEQTKTSRWREDWNEEEEIRKMNQRSTQIEDGNGSTELDTSLAVPDWPWSAENAPLPGDYRPWPENPPPKPEQGTKQQAEEMRSPARPPPPARFPFPCISSLQ
jgi:hypothetical protein